MTLLNNLTAYKERMRAALTRSADHQNVEDDVPTPISDEEIKNSASEGTIIHYVQVGEKSYVGVNITPFSIWVKKYGYLYRLNEKSFNGNGGNGADGKGNNGRGNDIGDWTI